MKKVVLLSIFLAMIVIVLGTYTRLTDASLGCPDWPSCYGHLSISKNIEIIDMPEQAFSERPFEKPQAWNEMLYQYVAGALGFLILVIFINCLFSKDYNKPVKLPFFLVLLVCLQAAVGMWTAAQNLTSAEVTSHLLVGCTLLSGLFLLYLRLTPYRIPGGDVGLRRFGKYSILGIIILTVQIALGGWTSANYASLACTELPTCKGTWHERLDFTGAFSIPSAKSHEFGVHDYIHRMGALFTFLYVCWFSITLYVSASSNLIKKLSVIMVLVLGVQITLGISNVVYSLPIAIAVMHNIVAAYLMMVLVTISYTLYRKT